jgi:hypothetical protein
MGIVLWITIYSSGIGLKKLLEVLHLVYSNPNEFDKYSNDFAEFMERRQ